METPRPGSDRESEYGKPIEVSFEGDALARVDEPLPFDPDDIECSDEMRQYLAKELGLPADASVEEVSEKKEADFISRMAVAMGLPKDATQEDVIKEEERLGKPNLGYYMLLGTSAHPSDEEIHRAVEKDDVRRRALLKRIAEEMLVNRAKKVEPLRPDEASE